MTALDFFEEIRFVLELLVAEHLFAAAVGLKKEAYGQRLLGGGAALLAAACVYPFLAGQFTYIDSHFLLGLVNVVWYVLLAVGSAFLIRLCSVCAMRYPCRTHCFCASRGIACSIWNLCW